MQSVFETDIFLRTIKTLLWFEVIITAAVNSKLKRLSGGQTEGYSNGGSMWKALGKGANLLQVDFILSWRVDQIMSDIAFEALIRLISLISFALFKLFQIELFTTDVLPVNVALRNRMDQ